MLLGNFHGAYIVCKINSTFVILEYTGLMTFQHSTLAI